MTDTYRLRRRVLARSAVLEITAAEYQAIKEAQDGLVRFIDIEEAYDIVVSNYVEYEKAIAHILIAEETKRVFDGSFFHADRRQMCRVTANLLSSIRLLHDLTESAIKAQFGEEEHLELKAFKSGLYDGSFAYRLMEKLRNHSQHKHFAVTGMSYNAQWIDHRDDEKRTRVHTFTPALTLHSLSGYRHFNKIVAEYREMRAANPDLPKDFELTRYVRSYMCSIGEIMEYLRMRYDTQVRDWAGVAAARLESYGVSDGDAKGIGVYAEHLRDEERVEEVYMGNDLFDDLMSLRKENRKFVNLDRLQFRM